MSQKNVQTQVNVQTQQQNTQQIMLSRVLELPIADMTDRVRNELLDNEALEECDTFRDADDDTYTDASGDEYDNSENDIEEAFEKPELNLAVGDYLSDDDIPDYLKQRMDAAREEREVVQMAGSTFYDDLYRQISEQNLSEQEQMVLEYLIGSLDADGFLRKDALTLSDELAVFHNIYAEEHEIETLIGVLQTFEPRGIGARDLQECLRLQLTDPDRKSPWRKQALEVINTCYKEFTSKRWDRIAERLALDEESLGHIRHELTHLNPAPGRAAGESNSYIAPTVIPDFFATKSEDGKVEVQLNNGEIPDIRVSRAFRDLLTDYAKEKATLSRSQQETYVYARKKVDDAQNFINLIQRRNETLLAIMRCIAKKQQAFFDDDDESLLLPLTLKDVATQVGVDISTVSRAVGSKYVQTLYGVYPLKHFFTGQFKGENGEDIATRKIKVVIETLIENEDKRNPLSDEAIAALLVEKGFPVARRTVAKYREQMGISVARLRKE